ncbi:MAG: GntR family transcriptional regulator [Arenicellaceae bacterium]|nr:GntR family transcriptional regulator [Arenicellaceae bacterium]
MAVSTASSKEPNQASSAYERLEQDILTGHLKPGERLRLKELIVSYNTGNSPMREALSRLSARGIVTREENRGFSVPHATKESLTELLKTRCWIEEIGLRESIANGDNEWEERIVLAFHWLSQSEKSDDLVSGRSPSDLKWSKHHQGFHMALISACNSDILIDFCTQLQGRSFRYFNLAKISKYANRNELEEHRELKDATLERDAELAVSKLKKHYTTTHEILLTSDRFD